MFHKRAIFKFQDTLIESGTCLGLVQTILMESKSCCRQTSEFRQVSEDSAQSELYFCSVSDSVGLYSFSNQKAQANF
jgi:hypothetical protein